MQRWSGVDKVIAILVDVASFFIVIVTVSSSTNNVFVGKYFLVAYGLYSAIESVSLTFRIPTQHYACCANIQNHVLIHKLTHINRFPCKVFDIGQQQKTMVE
jgi:hypothetical protein